MRSQVARTVAITTITCSALSAAVSSTRAQPAHPNRPGPISYIAHLQPLNTTVIGMQPTGEARFTIEDDSLTIDLTMHHVPPGMMHLQHFHGFAKGKNALCAPAAADRNDDGIVDLIETEPYSGTTMVPFTADPVSMQIVSDVYPRASAEGSYHYKKTVSLSALEAAFSNKFPGQKLELMRRVVYVHGVPSGTKLQSSVASLGTIPAQVTLPIACGKIERSGQ